MSTFTVDTVERGDVLIVRATGYLDDRGGAILQSAVMEALTKGFQQVVFNFSAAPVINSQGISHIIELVEIVIDEKNGELAFVGLNELTCGVFKMVGLLRMAESYSTEEEAVAGFSV